MAKTRSFLSETLKIWVQWLGAGCATIPAGILLGIMLNHGVTASHARIIAVAIGLVLGFAFWDLIGRLFSARLVVYSGAISSSTVHYRFRDDLIPSLSGTAEIVVFPAFQAAYTVSFGSPSRIESAKPMMIGRVHAVCRS